MLRSGGRFPAELERTKPHLLGVCAECPNSYKPDGCEWAHCSKFTSRERYFAALDAGDCPVGMFVQFTVNGKAGEAP